MRARRPLTAVKTPGLAGGNTRAGTSIRSSWGGSLDAGLSLLRGNAPGQPSSETPWLAPAPGNSGRLPTAEAWRRSKRRGLYVVCRQANRPTPVIVVPRHELPGPKPRDTSLDVELHSIAVPRRGAQRPSVPYLHLCRDCRQLASAEQVARLRVQGAPITVLCASAVSGTDC